MPCLIEECKGYALQIPYYYFVMGFNLQAEISVRLPLKAE